MEHEVVPREALTRYLTGLSCVRALPTSEQRAMVERAEAFLKGRAIIGVQGLRVGAVHRTLVAATAARMTCRVELEAFSALRLLVFYPRGVPRGKAEIAAGRTVRRPDGHVHVELCSWECLKGIAIADDGIDVIVHELAHVLDLEGGSFDGRPPLWAHQDHELWDEVISNYLALLRRGDESVRGVLRAYAGTNAAELFAVASEVYFERPASLSATCPALYRKLQRFYGAPRSTAVTRCP